MNKTITSGWTVNNPDLNTKLLTSLNSDDITPISMHKNEWLHTSLFSQNNSYIQHYQDTDISIIICGHPTIADNHSGQYSKVSTKPQLVSIVEKYKKHGYKFLRELNGSFSVVLFDTRNHITLLAIDRMGIEQMHYCCVDGQLVFSNSLISLSDFPTINKSIKPQSIYNYFYFHCIPSPDTIFENIYKLKPAEVLIFKNGALSKDLFWQPEFSERHSVPVEQLQSEVRHSMENTMSGLSVDPHTGAFLSGGTDSSTIAGLLKKYHPNDAPVFSIGFEEQGYDEMEFADIAVKKFKNKHHKYYVNFDDVLRLFDEIPKIYEEPFGNSSVVPTYAAAKYAKNHGINHLLGGDGGDELFGGNSRYVTQKLFNIYSNIPKWAREIILEPCFVNSVAASIPIAKKAKSYIEQAKIPMPQRMQTYNILHMQSPDSIFDKHYLDAIDPDYPVSLLSESYNQIADASLLNKMLYLDWKFTLADNDIRKVNTMCRAAGVEVSYPFLDNRVVECSTRIPSNLKIQGNRLRAFYKDTYSSLLPPEIIKKPKHGFGLPFGVWLKKDKRIQNEVYDVLNNLKARSMFRDDFIDNLITRHKSEHAAYYGTFVWVLAVLEKWLESHQ